MTTTSRSRFQTVALIGIAALLVAFGIQQLGGVTWAEGGEAPPPPPATPVSVQGDVLLDEILTVAPGAPVVIDLSSEDVILEQGPDGTARFVIEGETEAARTFFGDQNYRAVSEDGGAVLRARPDRRAERRRVYRDGDTPTVRVWVPAGAEVIYDGTSGDIRADKLDAARLSLDTGSGDLALGAVSAETVSIDTGSGDVAVERLDASRASLDTGSGDVSISRSSGELEIDTGSGDMDVSEHDGRFLADTGSGDVAVGLVGAREVEVSSGSGDVRIALGSPNAELRIDTNGEVALDVDGFSGRRDDGEVNGRLGAGGPPVTVDSGSGDVTVQLR